MNAGPGTLSRIDVAIAALGERPLDEAGLQKHVAPLFSRVLARNRERIYLANHSLGRPPDQIEDDVREALAAWYADLGGAWEQWSAELAAHRGRLARLMGAPRVDCVVPKTSAGAGLRAVLNAARDKLRVVTTRGEFDSLDVILREYAHRDRIALSIVEARGDSFHEDDILAAIARGCDLVVVSQAMFRTGQLLMRLSEIVHAAHSSGAEVLVDIYHSLGVVPVDVEALDVDYAVGGSYKYLRGGPGACFLYVAPRHLEARRSSLDIGWFAKETPFRYERPDPPRFAAGGDAWMESTPPIVTWYQARAGQKLTLALGVDRLREYSLRQQRALIDALADRGIEAQGATLDRSAFVLVQRADAAQVIERLRALGVDADARGDCLRLCPDVLTTSDEFARAADALARAL